MLGTVFLSHSHLILSVEEGCTKCGKSWVPGFLGAGKRGGQWLGSKQHSLGAVFIASHVDT